MSTLLAADPAAVIEHHPSPADLPGSPFAQALRQPILLGLFLPIQAGGWSASTLERTTDWRWEYNRDLVLKAEALGFDLVFALSQWLPKGGYGGVFDGNALDSFQTTAALTSITRRILLISTIHVLYGPLHPLHLAKWGATLDHISGGRWGINVVTGHREVEHRAFGTEQIEHDRRYELAAEFVDVLQRLWREDEPLSFSGRSSWKLQDAYAAALCAAIAGQRHRLGRGHRLRGAPFGRGLHHQPGRVGLRQRDRGPARPRRTREGRRARRRRVRTLLNPMVISRETESETRAYYEAIVARQDFRTPDGFQSLKSDAHAWRGREGVDPPSRRAIGGNIEVVGTPEQIVEQFVRLRQAGIDGLQLSFFDFKPDLEFFGDRILPLMKQAGLRT